MCRLRGENEKGNLIERSVLSSALSALCSSAMPNATTRAQEGRFNGSLARHAALVPGRRPSFSLIIKAGFRIT